MLRLSETVRAVFHTADLRRISSCYPDARRDRLGGQGAVKKLILVLAVCLHWFNPFVWVMYVLFNRDIELACDESVVRQCGEKARSAYALMLIDMEAKKSGLAPFCSSFSKNAVEERITAIMKMKKMTVTSLILACGIVAGTTTVFATSVRPAGDAWETDEEMTATALRRLGEKHPNMIDWLDQCYSEEIVWWTWEAYEQMMNTRLEELEGMMGEYIGWTPSTGDIYVTPDMLEEQKKEYEEILTKLKDGWLIAKSVDGGENLLMEIDPDLWEAGRGMREFQCSISLKDGTEVVFGPYDSEEKMLAAVEPFCREQVKKGNMEQDEMDEIVKRYSEKAD